jgi:hypothetical protein
MTLDRASAKSAEIWYARWHSNIRIRTFLCDEPNAAEIGSVSLLPYTSAPA